MKRLLILAVFTIVSFSAYAQFGVKFGLNFNSMKDVHVTNADATVSAKTGINAGILYRLRLPMGFAIQPELLYISKNSEVKVKSENSTDTYNTRMDYLQLPVNIQLGVDLVLLRPFIQLSPYIGYALSKGGEFSDVRWDNFDRFSYGIGLGAGIDIWKFQFGCRYCWDLGNFSDFKANEIPDQMENLKNSKNKGFEISAAFIF